MLPAETLITFSTASCLLALAPGPDNVFVLMQSVLHGRRTGFAVTLGLCTGLLVHSAAVVLGVATIFQTSPAAFSILKYLGAGYLIYLAWRAFQAGAIDTTSQSSATSKYGQLYQRGIVMNVTNPKVSLFFLAFLPQFADPLRGSVTVQLIMLGGLFNLATLLVFGSIAVLAGTLSKWLARSDRLQLVLNRLAAVVFLTLAVLLAISQR